MNNSIKSEGRQEANKKRPFQLLRYFTITSLIAFVLVAVSLVTFYRQIAVNELIEIGESKNTAITLVTRQFTQREHKGSEKDNE